MPGVEANKLLELEPEEMLVPVPTGAEEHRCPATECLHYVSFPRDSCNYLPQRDCPYG